MPTRAGMQSVCLSVEIARIKIKTPDIASVTAGNTYVAGCTDPSFGSPECLHKPPPFHDQEWVAINQACKNLNENSASDNITNWTGCVVDNNSTELVKLPMASCTPYCEPTNVLYAGSSSLAAFASLPTLAGSSIFWQNNFVPPATPAPGYTQGSPTGVVPSGAPTSTGSPTTGTDTGLSVGAKAGIGAGAAVGGLLLLAILTSLIIACMKRRRPNQNQQDEYHHPAAAGQPLHGHYPQYSQDMTSHPHGGHPSPPLPYSNTYPHFGVAPAFDTHQHSPHTPVAAYTGYKSELPADEPPYPQKGTPSPGPSPPFMSQQQQQQQLPPQFQHTITPGTETNTMTSYSQGSPPLSSASTVQHGSSGTPGGGLPGGVGIHRATSSTHTSYSNRVSPQYSSPEGPQYGHGSWEAGAGNTGGGYAGGNWSR